MVASPRHPQYATFTRAAPPAAPRYALRACQSLSTTLGGDGRGMGSDGSSAEEDDLPEDEMTHVEFVGAIHDPAYAAAPAAAAASAVAASGDQFPGFSPRVGNADLAPRAARRLPRASGPSGALGARGGRRAARRLSDRAARAGGPIILPDRPRAPRDTRHRARALPRTSEVGSRAPMGHNRVRGPLQLPRSRPPGANNELVVLPVDCGWRKRSRSEPATGLAVGSVTGAKLPPHSHRRGGKPS
jgi:hypothetical protein